MKRTHKKGFALIMISMAFLLGALAIWFMGGQIDNKEYVGAHQYALLQTNEKTQFLQLYIDLASTHTGVFASKDLFTHAGLYKETLETGPDANHPCGSYTYPLYSNKNKNCLPNYRESYEQFFKKTLKNYQDNHPIWPINFYYDLSIDQQNNNQARVLGRSQEDLQIPVEGEMTVNKQYYKPNYIQPTDETIIPCSTGTCVSELANYYHELYMINGQSFPYIWGGETPYDPDATRGLTNNPESFFYGTYIDQTQPGFDCSGWVWWINKHAGVPGYEQRLTAQDYFVQAKMEAQLICGLEKQDCLQPTIIERAQAGDILFYGKTPNQITHIMIYLGNGKISHSSGSQGLVQEIIPSFYASETQTNIQAIYRYNYQEEGIETLQDTTNCTSLVNIEYDQQLVEGTVLSIEELEIMFQQYNTNEIIAKAHQQFPKVPPEMIKAIIGAEVGAHGYIEKYLSEGAQDFSNGKACNSVGYCGPMQVGEDACDTITQTKTYSCSLEKIERGDVEEGIMAGTAQLSWLIDPSFYLDQKEPNLYFLAIAYNAGPGSLKYILETASERLGKPIPELEFSDLEYDDIKNGMIKVGASWAKKKSKWDEVWLYSQKVGKVLSEQCGGSLYVTPQQNYNQHILYKPYIDTTITMNFNELEQLHKFVKEVQTYCVDELEACVKERIEVFNQKNTGVRISMNKEENALANDFTDQLLDCFTNEQDQCYCPIHINEELQSTKEEFVLRIEDDGKVLYENTLVTRLPFTPTKLYTNKELQAPSIRLTIDKQDMKDSTLYAQSQGSPYTWDMERIDGSSNIVLQKQTQQEYLWQEYNETAYFQECRNNKKQFRIQANFTFTTQQMNFSIYLEDQQPPQLQPPQLQQTTCNQEPNIKINWEIFNTSEEVYDYIISITGENKSYHILEKEAQEQNGSLLQINTLYKKETSPTNTYTYIISGLPSKQKLELNKTYTFTITARDHYLNTISTQAQDIFLEEHIQEQLLAQTVGVDLSTLHLLQNVMNYGLCAQNGYRIAKYENNTLSEWEEEGIIGTIQKPQQPQIDITGFEIYPGITNPETGAPLYKITNISNVICDETITTVGKICATNPELLTQLHKLSQEVLQPQNLILYVTQAFRTTEIQAKLWEQYNRDSSLACNPYKKICPHMIAGAIDLQIYDLENTYVGDSLQEEIMCNYGFVRYSGESWHFEYGTWRWEEAETKRARGEQTCSY